MTNADDYEMALDFLKDQQDRAIEKDGENLKMANKPTLQPKEKKKELKYIHCDLCPNCGRGMWYRPL